MDFVRSFYFLNALPNSGYCSLVARWLWDATALGCACSVAAPSAAPVCSHDPGDARSTTEEELLTFNMCVNIRVRVPVT